MPSTVVADDFNAARPSLARYGVLFFLCTLALLLYVDRICIGQAAQAICSELHLTKTHLGWANTAFIIAYCFFEVPTGNWGDRFGSRRVIARIVIWWSLFTALTGMATGLWTLIAYRFLFGAGEAGAFPNAARVVTHWFPPTERGFARGAITTTSQLGGALALPIAAYLILLVGWRYTFAVFGLLGIAWTAAFYFWFRDDPHTHPAANDAERNLIGRPTITGEGHPPIPWNIVLTSPNVWLLGTIMAVGAALFYLQFQWFPTYLKGVHGLDEATSGWFSGLVILGGAAGCLAGGLLADTITRRIPERRWSRRLCGGGMLALSALSVFAFGYSESPLAATLCNAAALFCLQVSIPTWWTVVAEISGKHGAAMFGLMNGLGGVGVLVMNLLVGPVVDAREKLDIARIDVWRPVFAGIALSLAAGALCWLMVDATKSIVDRHTKYPQP
jgi:ACS family glucarate transporter-like MFS transporter